MNYSKTKGEEQIAAIHVDVLQSASMEICRLRRRIAGISSVEVEYGGERADAADDLADACERLEDAEKTIASTIAILRRFGS